MLFYLLVFIYLDLHLHLYFYIFLLRSYWNAQLKIYINNCAIEINKIIIIVIKVKNSVVILQKFSCKWIYEWSYIWTAEKDMKMSFGAVIYQPLQSSQASWELVTLWLRNKLVYGI